MRITMSLSQASYIMTFYNSLTGYEEFSLFGSMSFESPNRIILSSKSDFVLGPFMEGSVQHNINPVTLNIPRKYVCDGNEISDLKPQETTSWVNAVNAFPQ